MQYIEQVLYLAKDYWLLSIILGFLAAFIESFIPAIPLMAIAAINAAINGFIVGFLTSWLGSCMGTVAVFCIIKKIFNTDFFKKHWLIKLKDKLDAMVRKVKKSEFKALFIFYAIPVLPSSLLTLASAICEIEYKVFIPPMIFGKFLMMFCVSYIGSDLRGLIKNPIKIAVVVFMGLVSYIIANKMKKDMEVHEDAAVTEYKRMKYKRRIKKENDKMLIKQMNENKLTPGYVPSFFMKIIKNLLEFFRKLER